MAARKSHPGFGAVPVPPIAGGISVLINSPFGPRVSQTRPETTIETAGGTWILAFSGIAVKRAVIASSAWATTLAVIRVSGSRD